MQLPPADAAGPDDRGPEAHDPAVRRDAAPPSPATSPTGPAPDGAPGWSRHHRRAALAAAGTLAVLVVAAAVLDPSALAAPVAWTRAHPTWSPWTWLQYVLLAPLMVLLTWWGARALLRAATPSAPRRWVFARVWLLVVVAMMTAKVAYSFVLMGPALLGGRPDGLPVVATSAEIAWSVGLTGVKAAVYGWLPALAAALAWAPGRARRAGIPARVAQPAGSLLPAAVVVLVLALASRWTADHWWTGSPVGYAHPSGWRLLAPTVASGRVGEIAALVLAGLLLATALAVTLRRMEVPRPAGARMLAGALASVAAFVGLAVVQSLVALMAGTDVPGSDDLWIVPSTYLRLVEGLSFGLLVAPVAAVAVWASSRAPRAQWSWVAGVAAAAVLVGAVVVVVRGTQAYAGPPPLAGTDPAPVALPPGPVALPPGSAASARVAAAPARITVRRDTDGHAVLADQRGAQVILRGINVNQLGDYYAADPAVPTVAPLTEQDFTDLAAFGFNTVRLVLSWSFLEPESGRVDGAYLDTVKQAVNWAAAHGIHVVLDVHQDAWGKEVVAPAGTTCRPGTSPMTGWDGAPGWASYFDDAPPCQFTGRDLAPNVLRGFTSFYTDRSDVEAHLVDVWARLAQEFGGNPAVAGYDLLNEPSFAEQAPLTSALLLGRYHARAIAAIRSAEAAAPQGYAHPVFLEPSIWWSGFGLDPLPPHGFTTDSQVVFAPHLYNESITMDQTLGVDLVGIERGYSLAERAATDWGTPLWVGEWGTFGGEAENLERNARVAQAEDARMLGSAVWVWKQGCGDPHVLPGPEAGNIRRVACPEGTPLPMRRAELEPLFRSYPRSAPGRITAIRTEGRRIQVDGSTVGAGPVDGIPDPCALDVWVPGAPRPSVLDAVGLTDVQVTPVPAGGPEQAPSGGWRVSGCAAGDYRLSVS